MFVRFLHHSRSSASCGQVLSAKLIRRPLSPFNAPFPSLHEQPTNYHTALQQSDQMEVARSIKAAAPVAQGALKSAEQAVAPAWKSASAFGAAALGYAAANPVTAACGVVTVGGLAVVAAPAVLTSPLLAAAGFTPLGPAAGKFS